MKKPRKAGGQYGVKGVPEWLNSSNVKRQYVLNRHKGCPDGVISQDTVIGKFILRGDRNDIITRRFIKINQRIIIIEIEQSGLLNIPDVKAVVIRFQK